MNNSPDLSFAEQLAAAQEWWRGAGVEFDYLDDAKPWLAEVESADDVAPPPTVAQAEVKAAPEPVKPLVEAGDLPDDLEAFQKWWCDPASPLPAAAGTRIAPRGVVGAKLMVVVPTPESGDTETLLSGTQGTLIGNILRALQIDAEAAYFGSALPSAMAEPDWLELQRQGLGSVLAHHIGLARPERVLLFGRGLPLLLGHAPDAPPEAFAACDSPGGKLPALTTFAPDRLLGHARQRARLWHRLLDWMT